MGRHRSTLRELGWGISNSPNPWKQGSAKRVVRTLDYSQAEMDEPPPAEPPPAAEAAQPPPPAGHKLDLDDKLAQLQQDGKQQLDRIREQFEAQEAESKRKLERLNGRIAELGDGKRAMWGALGQQKPRAGVVEPVPVPVAVCDGAGAPEAQSAAAPADRDAATAAALAQAESALAKRDAELTDKAAALDKAEADAAAKAEAAKAAQQAVEAREAGLAEREAAVAARETAVGDRETQAAATRERLAEREADLNRTAAALAAREKALADAQGKLPAADAPCEAEAVAATSAALRNAVAGHAQEKAGGKAEAAPPAKLARPAEAKPAPKAESADEQRSKVRFHEQRPPAVQPAAAAGAKEAKVVAAKAKVDDSKDIQCDCSAEWARTENLTASLVRQRTENPDEVFHPLAHQRTCELADIFSAPRRRERGKGSGEWTPLSTEDPARAIAFPPPREAAAPAQQAKFQLLGVDGEYMGEQLPLPVPATAATAAKCILLGRSSSCDITLSRDDQISRRHMQIDWRDNKLFARDLGSTYGTRVNGKALGAEAVEIKPSDVLVLGASTFQLQMLGK